MFRIFRSISGPVRAVCIGRRCWAAALAACLGLTGCAGLDLRGEGYPGDELCDWTGKFREQQDCGDSFVWSNKARQIDRNFGRR